MAPKSIQRIWFAISLNLAGLIGVLVTTVSGNHMGPFFGWQTGLLVLVVSVLLSTSILLMVWGESRKRIVIPPRHSFLCQQFFFCLSVALE